MSTPTPPQPPSSATLIMFPKSHPQNKQSYMVTYRNFEIFNPGFGKIKNRVEFPAHNLENSSFLSPITAGSFSCSTLPSHLLSDRLGITSSRKGEWMSGPEKKEGARHHRCIFIGCCKAIKETGGFSGLLPGNSEGEKGLQLQSNH